MQENLEIGVERVRCQICQAEEGIAVRQTEEDLDLTLVESVESVVSHMPKAMARFETLGIGSEEVLYHLFLNKSVVLEMEVAREQQMMALGQKDLETVKHHQLLGARDVLNKAHKMEARGPQDANSKSDQLSRERLPLLSKTTNGVRR